MIIERFYPDKVKELYQRFEEKGRLLPLGVHYINSWIDEKVEICYQVMESESLEKLQEWINNWSDLAAFEIIPVISSAQAKAKVFSI
ncbi:MAG: DUF3303 family protein [Saprospiraceae bacterium]|nr:DUF3303 family protein [Saprospiraceae bacterium]